MYQPSLILLTGDSEFERAAQTAAILAGCGLIVGRNPEDGARLFARSLDSICGVIVDLDSCLHGSAWLTAMTSLNRKIPGLAVSRLQPHFLRPLACRHGAEYWLSKPVTSGDLAGAFRMLRDEGWGAVAAPKRSRAADAFPPVAGAEDRLSDDGSVPWTLACVPAGFQSRDFKTREFAVYCGTGHRCFLKEEGASDGRRFEEITDAIDFLVGLDMPHRAMLTAYDHGGRLFTIAI